MPRRPSAATHHATSAASHAASRVHKSNGSHSHSPLPQSTSPQTIVLSSANLGASATPQQKILQVLVTRLKNKLPCHSGVQLDVLEADRATQQIVEALVELSYDSLDIIALALSELLERLARKDVKEVFTLEMLQSQLFILKVLSVAMASRWNRVSEERPSPTANKSPRESPAPPSKARSTFSDHSTTPHMSLDDNCARYILSVMVMFLRQTNPPGTKSTFKTHFGIDPSFRDFESLDVSTIESVVEASVSGSNLSFQSPDALVQRESPQLNSTSSSQSVTSQSTVVASFIPPCGLYYERSHSLQINSAITLSNIIAKFAGRVIYHLSASNWPVVFHRLRSKIYFLAQTTDERPDTIDLQLMAYCALDRSRLIQVLNELSSLLVNMKPDVQVAVSIPLRVAVWNWIEIFPAEFNEVVRSRGRMEGAPERVFDLLYKSLSGNEKLLWPTLMSLNCISSERISLDLQMNHATSVGQKNRKDNRFVEDLIRHSNTTSKLADVALLCLLDMCKAALHVRPEGEVPLRMVAYDIAHEVKSALWKNSVQKPFWESADEIDVDLYSQALVTIFRYMPEEESVALFSTCLEPERSEAVKICVVKACVILEQEAKRLPSQKSLQKLQEVLTPRLRAIYKTSILRRHELDQNNVVKKASPRPKVKHATSEMLSDKEILLLGLLSLWRYSTAFFMTSAMAPEIDEWFSVSLKLWEAPIDNTVKISAACSFRLSVEASFRMPLTHELHESHIGLTVWMRRALADTLLKVATNLIYARGETKDQQLWIQTTHKIIEFFWRTCQAFPDSPPVETFAPACALSEIALLITLTSADNEVTKLAAHSLRLIALTERRLPSPENGNPVEEATKRYHVYEQLGDPNVTIIGKVGYQKRMRKLVRMIASPSPAHVAVWEECYWRWRSLSEFVLQGRPAPDEHEKNPVSRTWEEKHIQWRNLTLFLAAFGGVCVEEGQTLGSLTSVIPAEYLPDQLRALQHPGVMVETFVTELTDLLVVDSMQVREVAREALGTELSPRLYSRLLKHLEEIIRRITQGAGTELTDTFVLFLDQFIAVLKLLVENAQVPVEEVMGIDLSSTLFALGSFVSRFDNRVSYRIQIKYCALCESVCRRADMLSLRRDTGARHNILDLIVTWIQAPVMLENDPDAIHIQVELNLCCLRTAVKLLDRLQLRPLDESSGDDSGVLVARLFSNYSEMLLGAINTCQIDESTTDAVSEVPSSLQRKSRTAQREADLRELIITGLSHLVSANTESGFKNCLPMAYDESIRNRIIFAHVFSRVLSKGTKFDVEENPTMMSRRNRLVELVKGSDMVLVMAICETCPPADVDVMMSVLMSLFDTRSSLMSLLKMMIDREIARTDDESSLFRANSTCTKFLSHFAKVHGYTYVRSIVVPLIKAMTSMPPGCSFELDPNRNGGQDTTANQRNIEMIASSFLKIISSSLPAMPSMFREICAHIAKATSAAWPDSKFAAVGAFLFLRFITPAVVSPETIDVDLPKDGTANVIRRGLMLIAKILQNLANNLYFGKEPHMASLNDFMSRNVDVVSWYLTEVNKFSKANMNDDPDEWLGSTTDDTDIIVLHRYFSSHADKIGKELLSYAKPAGEDEDDSSEAASGKDAWNAVCATLVDLGEPLEAPRLSEVERSDHKEYIDLMYRFANRNTDSVRDIFVEAPLPQHLNAVFVMRLSKIDVEVLDIELLMFHIFQTLSTAVNEERPFDIILDCTSFSSLSEIPVQWLKHCFELIPADLQMQFMMTIILNPNSLAQKYLKRVYNICAGTRLCVETKAASSVKELLEMNIPSSCLEQLQVATALEDESSESFQEVTMRVAQHLRLPVSLEIGSSHVRITSVRALSVSPSLTCKPIEIIALTDISDVYNVSTGHDPHEFIIRRSRPGSTTYFTSPSRDWIVKSIRTAKGKMRDTLTTDASHSFRYSSAPATLLHVGMLGVDSEDEELRNAAYDLLGAVCSHLNYDKNPVVTSKAGFIPGDPTTFTAQLSERLADFIPSMTLDFIAEVAERMTKPIHERINSLHYLSPWIKNLVHFPNPSSTHYEPSGSRIRDCIRTLTDMTVRHVEIAPTIQKCIWSEIGKLDSSVSNIVLDELIRSATDGGIGSQRCEVIARIVANLSSISVRGRIYSSLRKALYKTSNKVTRTLPENMHWGEIATLIRLALFAGNQSKQLSYHQLYVPEILHVVSYTAGYGPILVRQSVYGILLNLLQAVYMSRSEDSGGPDLLNLIDECAQPRVMHLFGLEKATPTAEYEIYNHPNDKIQLDSQQDLMHLLVRVMELTSGSNGLLNVWRARWMSLVTSTAFQYSPAIQTCAFMVIGTLATTDIDDDFVYQILVAFKVALSRSTETDTITVVCMLRCMCKIVPALAPDSRSTCQMFWLGVAMLQSSHMAFFVEAADLVRISLETMQARGAFKDARVSQVLLEGRIPLQDIACQLDQVLRLSFESSFSFTLASILFKGLRHSPLSASAEASLRTILRVTTETSCSEEQGSGRSLHPDALGYFLALLPLSITIRAHRRLLEDSNFDAFVPSEANLDVFDQEREIPRLSLEVLGIKDSTTALLVSSFVGAILTSAQGNDAESEMLYMLLADVAMVFPEIVAMTYEGLQDRIKDTFANSSNASVIQSVSTIFHVALQETGRSGIPRGSASTLGTADDAASSHGPGKNHLKALEELGMQGLASSFQFLPPNRGHATKMINWIAELVISMIE